MVTKTLITFLIIITSLTMVYGQSAESKSIAVTVYNANLGVIKDMRTINIPKGKSKIEIADVAQQIDPTSVHIGFDGEVIEQNYQYDLV